MKRNRNSFSADQMHRLNDELFVSAAPEGETELRALTASGFKSVVDLRGEGEPIHGIPPEREREIVESVGLSYQHIPISVTPLTRATIDQVRLALWAAEAPVLLHCGSGRRAWLCALLHVGCQHGWTVEQCLELTGQHRVDLDEMPAMRNFLCDFIQRNSRAYLPFATSGASPATDSYQI